MAGLIGTSKLTQVGFIVKDIVASKHAFAEFLGLPVPEHFDAGKYEITQTTVQGEPAPDANCMLAFFDIGEGVQLELIAPNGVKSTWQDYLDQRGEGIHHIAFNVEGMDKKLEICGAWGLPCVQRGKYGDASGEYAYMDGGDKLKCVVELLESFR